MVLLYSPSAMPIKCWTLPSHQTVPSWQLPLARSPSTRNVPKEGCGSGTFQTGGCSISSKVFLMWLRAWLSLWMVRHLLLPRVMGQCVSMPPQIFNSTSKPLPRGGTVLWRHHLMAVCSLQAAPMDRYVFGRSCIVPDRSSHIG